MANAKSKDHCANCGFYVGGCDHHREPIRRGGAAYCTRCGPPIEPLSPRENWTRLELAGFPYEDSLANWEARGRRAALAKAVAP